MSAKAGALGPRNPRLSCTLDRLLRVSLASNWSKSSAREICSLRNSRGRWFLNVLSVNVGMDYYMRLPIPWAMTLSLRPTQFGSWASRNINIVLCDNSPSAAPSVHWTERVARHFQQRLDSIMIDSCHSPSSSLRYSLGARKVRGFDSHFSDFDEVLSENCDDIPETFFYMV